MGYGAVGFRNAIWVSPSASSLQAGRYGQARSYGVECTPSIGDAVIANGENSGRLRYRAKVEMTWAISAIAIEMFPF